jgi:pantoate--beta-alanine ligase
MIIARTRSELAAARAALPGPVGAVLTLGGLHSGHVALLRAARREVSSVVATVFVNPRQFTTDAVASEYPHDENADFGIFEAEGVEVAFAPAVETVYPPGFTSEVRLPGFAEQLEGVSRPGHFKGVATVVAILLRLIRPDFTYFGQKDWQQTRIVQQLVGNLQYEVDVRVVGTVRDSHGVALGTRNTLLSAGGLEAARVVPQGLSAGAEAWNRGQRRAEALEREMLRVLAAQRDVTVDYVAARDPVTFGGITENDDAVALLVAAEIEGVRLIDNVVLGDGLIDIDPTTLLSAECVNVGSG